jgi:hypothetical protein
VTRRHDLPCPCSDFTAEVNLHALAVEVLDAHGRDLAPEEVAAALDASSALLRLVAGRRAST